MVLVSADTTSRVRVRQHAYIRGTTVCAFNQPGLARECDQVRDLLRLARVSLVGFDLNDPEQRDTAFSLIARNVALNSIGVTEQAVDTRHGNRPDPALLASFRTLRDNALSELHYAARMLGHLNVAGLIAEFGQTGGR